MNGDTHRAVADLRSGTDESLYRVFDELQGELRTIVRRARGGAHGDSLRTTELFNEAYLKLRGASARATLRFRTSSGTSASTERTTRPSGAYSMS